MKCLRCGTDDAMAYFGNSCSKCESPRPELGETSRYCDDNMHVHCHGEFDYDCGCGCHEAFNNGMFELRKPMTEEYFLMMVDKSYFSWILLARAVPLEKLY